MEKALLLQSLIIATLLCFSDGQTFPTPPTGSNSLAVFVGTDHEMRIHVVNLGNDFFQFTIHTVASAWIGVAIPKNPTEMPLQDCYIGWNDGNTDILVEDYIVGAARSTCGGGTGVCLDTDRGGVKSITDESITIAGGITTMVFTRLRDTGDSTDNPMVADGEVQNLNYAVGAGITLGTHLERGWGSITLPSPVAAPTTPTPVASPITPTTPSTPTTPTPEATPGSSPTTPTTPLAPITPTPPPVTPLTPITPTPPPVTPVTPPVTPQPVLVLPPLPSGVNPVLECVAIKLERWVAFWGYSSDRDTTISYGSSNQILGGMDPTLDPPPPAPAPYDPQPEHTIDFHVGYHRFQFATKATFFTMPVNGRRLTIQQWELDGKKVSINLGESLYHCPQSAEFTIVINIDAVSASSAADALGVYFSQATGIDVRRFRVTPSVYSATDDPDFNRATFEPTPYLDPAHYGDETEPLHKWEVLLLISQKLGEDPTFLDGAAVYAGGTLSTAPPPPSPQATTPSSYGGNLGTQTGGLPGVPTSPPKDPLSQDQATHINEDNGSNTAVIIIVLIIILIIIIILCCCYCYWKKRNSKKVESM